MFEEEWDLSNTTMGEIEAVAGRLAPGWYKAKVASINVDEHGTVHLTFEVIGGTYAGFRITERVRHGGSNADPDKAKKIHGRRQLFAKRLGLITETSASVKFSWLDAADRQAWIDVREAKGSEGGTFLQLDWAGVYPLDDEKVPQWVREGKPAPEAAASKPGQRKPATPAPAKPVPSPSLPDDL